MAVTVDDLINRVGGSYNNNDDLARALSVATTLVNDFVGTSVVPTEVKDECYLRVAEAIFNQSNVAPAAETNYYDNPQSGTWAPTNRNPMQSAYQLLRSYVLPW